MRYVCSCITLGSGSSAALLTRQAGCDESSGQEEHSMVQQFLRATMALVALGGAAEAATAAFTPWGPLVNESWIAYDPADPKLTVHTANGGDNALGFDQAKNDDSARGMNSVRFVHGGADTGRLAAASPSGTFAVSNGGDQAFSDLLLVIAIDAASLPAEFALTLTPDGRQPVQLDGAVHFGYYDPAGYQTGRPTGYYPSVTRPVGEPISYCFDRGMVAIVAISGLALNRDTDPAIDVDYAFENLPGKAVFSAYAQIEGAGWVYHTNRGVVDDNRPGGAVSTFEVLPEPCTLALLGCAGGLILARRRR
jgi:hypothetical protein